MFAARADTWMQRLRKIALVGTEWAQATRQNAPIQNGTIRVKRLKIGAAIPRNTRRARILLASHPPLRPVFLHAVSALSPWRLLRATTAR